MDYIYPHSYHNYGAHTTQPWYDQQDTYQTNMQYAGLQDHGQHLGTDNTTGTYTDQVWWGCNPHTDECQYEPQAQVNATGVYDDLHQDSNQPIPNNDTYNQNLGEGTTLPSVDIEFDLHTHAPSDYTDQLEYHVNEPQCYMSEKPIEGGTPTTDETCDDGYSYEPGREVTTDNYLTYVNATGTNTHTEDNYLPPDLAN